MVIFIYVDDADLVKYLDRLFDTFVQSIAENLEQLVEYFDVSFKGRHVVVIDVYQVGENLEYLQINAGRRIPKQFY